MKNAIGTIEYRSVASGVEATDIMLKSGNVKLLFSTILCPGKLVTMVTGSVGAVEAAVRNGAAFRPEACVDSLVISNLHESVFPALSATTEFISEGSLGIIETVDAVSAIIAGDTAVKAARVNLLEIRIARGMGGKGLVLLCGELSAVEASLQSAVSYLKEEGTLIDHAVIASPHSDLSL